MIKNWRTFKLRNSGLFIKKKNWTLPLPHLQQLGVGLELGPSPRTGVMWSILRTTWTGCSILSIDAFLPGFFFIIYTLCVCITGSNTLPLHITRCRSRFCLMCLCALACAWHWRRAHFFLLKAPVVVCYTRTVCVCVCVCVDWRFLSLEKRRKVSRALCFGVWTVYFFMFSLTRFAAGWRRRTRRSSGKLSRPRRPSQRRTASRRNWQRSRTTWILRSENWPCCNAK